MNGMHQTQSYAYNVESDDYTASWDWELPPTPTLAQITLGHIYEFDDKSHVDLGFTSCQYLDQNGVTRTDTFPDIDNFDAVHVFAKMGLVRADFQMRVSNISASWVANFFFWDNVS